MTAPTDRAIEALRELVRVIVKRHGVIHFLELERAHNEARAALAAADAQPAEPVQEPVTLADVLDALNVFNKWRPSEGGEPWTEADFISVKYLPDFINTVAAAWFSPTASAASTPPTPQRWMRSPPKPVPSALATFESNGETDELNPIERLRYFCSLAMDGQDWLDVEPFFDALYTTTRRQPLTDEQLEELFRRNAGYGQDDFMACARAIERHHGIGEDI